MLQIISIFLIVMEKRGGNVMGVIEFPKDRLLDIIPIGRIAIDFNPVDYFKPLSESTTFKKYLGGSPANIAVGMARLGRKVGFIAKVSDDQFGDFVVNYFRKEGIDTEHISRCKNGEKLGLTFTEILSETQSSILMYRNEVADLQLEVADIEEEYIKNSKAILISGTALAMSPSREAALKAMSLAKKHNTIIVFDIDYRPYNWKNADEIAIYYSLVARSSDIILGSREEFDLTQKLIAPDCTDAQTAAFWHKEGAKIVVIKHGKEGSTAYLKDGSNYGIKPFPVKLLKSFGGGDGYASAFLYGLFEGWDIIDCLEFGSASAALLVASHACSEDMPSVEMVKSFIIDSKLKYGDMIARV
jgi:5-dehydro-2-deoxygluconokinase